MFLIEQELIVPQVTGDLAAISGNTDMLVRETDRENAEKEDGGVQEINIDSR